MLPRILVPANAQPTASRPVESRLADAQIEAQRRLPPDGPPASQHDLFGEALLTKPALGHNRTLIDWFVSFAVHVAMIAAVVIIPLFFTQVINPQQLQLTYLVAPPLPVAPAPPPPPAAALAPRPKPQPVNTPATAKLTMPIAIPKVIEKPADATEVAEAAPDITGGVPGGVPDGVPGGLPGGLLGGVAGGTPGGTGLAAPPPPPEPAAPGGPLQVGGAVKPPHLIFAPQPEYPILAKQARIQGVVQIDAIIDPSGNVVQERAVSGSGVLVAAALDAVKQWKYEPTYLNGKPYPVELAVNVTFRL